MDMIVDCIDHINNALNIPFNALACVPLSRDVRSAFADSPRLLERMAVDEPAVGEGRWRSTRPPASKRRLDGPAPSANRGRGRSCHAARVAARIRG